MNINLGNATVGGEFKVVLKNKDGDVTQETPWNNNLLTDYFFANPSPTAMYGFVGTGSAVPLPTDTKLSSIIGSASPSGTSITSGSDTLTGDATTGYTTTSRSYIFRWNIGSIVGNISEWGWAANTSSTSSYLLSVRSLIKDANNNPATISVTASDQLEIWWRLKKKAPGATQMSAGARTQTIVLNGVSTQVTFSMLNPTHLGTVMSGSTANRVEMVTSLYARTIVDSSANAITLRDAAAGTDIATTATIANEQCSNSGSAISPTITNPSPGVTKYTYTDTFPLLAGASSSNLQFIAIDRYLSTSGTRMSELLAKITFNPQFVKGPDKILTVSFSYTVTRAP